MQEKTYCEILHDVYAKNKNKKSNGKKSRATITFIKVVTSVFFKLNVSHLLKDFAIRLELIFLTEHLSGAKAVSLGKQCGCIFKHLIQGVHPRVHAGQ